MFTELLKKHQMTDIIAGKVANDKTAATIQQYIRGLFPGTPGLPETDHIVIQTLLPDRLQDQFCFRTEAAIAGLEFIRSDRYGDVKT